MAGGDAAAARWIALAVLLGYVFFFYTTFLIPDCSGTYAWGRSLLFDRDIDFRNDFERLGSIAGDDRVRFQQITEQGVPGNPFGMGSALLWAPFVGGAELLLRLTGHAGSAPGFGTLHLLAAGTGTVLFGLAALLLSYGAARRYASGPEALAAAMACGFGTPFLAYLYYFPIYAHVNAAFGAALALAASLWARREGRWWRWALAGAAAGLAAMVRAQHLALLAVPVALWLPRLRGADRRRALGSGLALAGGALAVFGWQLVAWHRLYGRPWRIPQGSHFLDLAHPHLWDVLFSGWHGLFPWAPVLLPAVAGLALLWGRDRSLCLGITVALILETWLIAGAADWWAGYAIGARRFVDLTPIFVLGLAVAFSWARPRLGRAMPATVAAAAVLVNLLLTLQVRTRMLSPFREIELGAMIAGLPTAAVQLPAYLWRSALTPPWSLFVVPHRGSAVATVLDPAPDWLLLLGLLICWALGLAGLYGLERLSQRVRRAV